MSERGRSATRRPRAGDSQSDQSDESSDGSSGKHAKKRGAHGQRGSPAEVPSFMRLSGEAAASGRRSRSSSRSSSPASGVDDARAVSGEGRCQPTTYSTSLPASFVVKEAPGCLLLTQLRRRTSKRTGGAATGACAFAVPFKPLYLCRTLGSCIWRYRCRKFEPGHRTKYCPMRDKPDMFWLLRLPMCTRLCG